MDLNNLDLNDIDFENMGSWPMPGKVIMTVVVFVLTLAAGYHFDIEAKLSELKSAKQKEQILKATFQKRYSEAKQIDEFKDQVSLLQKQFRSYLDKFPTENQIPQLLEDISQQALSSGLSYRLIKPAKQQDKGFYVELPLQLRLVGSYHRFGEFISGVSDLRRIVTLHDFSLTVLDDESDNQGNLLAMDVLAKTYWYTGKDEKEAVKVNNRKDKP